MQPIHLSKHATSYFISKKRINLYCLIPLLIACSTPSLCVMIWTDDMHVCTALLEETNHPFGFSSVHRFTFVLFHNKSLCLLGWAMSICLPLPLRAPQQAIKIDLSVTPCDVLKRVSDANENFPLSDRCRVAVRTEKESSRLMQRSRPSWS
jgi:hypothetical protein